MGDLRFAASGGQPLAESLDQLQAQVEAFDHIYNTERPHQGLPGRVTPLTAWEATPKAQPPRPRPRALFTRPASRYQPAPRARPNIDLPAGTHLRTLSSAGTFGLDSVFYMVDSHRAFEHVLVTNDGDTIIVADTDGQVLTTHTRPTPGVKYVGNGRKRGPRPKPSEPSPKS